MRGSRLGLKPSFSDVDLFLLIAIFFGGIRLLGSSIDKSHFINLEIHSSVGTLHTRKTLGAVSS
jgi:hypothetical protein